MADKYKLKSGEKAIVTVEFPEEVEVKPKRGYLGDEELFYPSRRLSSGIRFFDCGWVWNGSEYELLPYLDPRSATPISDNGTSFTNVYSTIDSSHYAQRDGLILDYEPSTWSSKFKQIDNTLSNRFDAALALRIRVNGTFFALDDSDTDVWRNGIFYLPEPIEEEFAIAWGIGTEFPDLGTAGLNQKITTEYDPNADAVTLDWGNSFDLFLMPAIYSFLGSTDYPRQISDFSSGPDSPAFSDTTNIVGHSVIYPRDVFYNDDHPFFARVTGGVPIEVGFAATYSSLGGDSLAIYTSAYHFLDYAGEYMTIAGRSRRFSDVRTPPDPTLTRTFGALDPSDQPEASLWPAPPSIVDSSTSGLFDVRIDNNFFAHIVGADHLVAIVRKGGQTYYVWYIEP